MTKADAIPSVPPVHVQKSRCDYFRVTFTLSALLSPSSLNMSTRSCTRLLRSSNPVSSSTSTFTFAQAQRCIASSSSSTRSVLPESKSKSNVQTSVPRYTSTPTRLSRFPDSISVSTSQSRYFGSSSISCAEKATATTDVAPDISIT